MFVSLTIALLAQPVAPELLQPDGAWQLDQRGCTLSRAFRSEAGPVTFALKRFVDSPGGELVLVLPGRANGRYQVDEGRITTDGGATIPAVWSRVGQRNQPYDGVTIQPDDSLWSVLSSVRTLTVDTGPNQRVSFALGGMTAPTAALDTCRAERAGQLAATRTANRRR